MSGTAIAAASPRKSTRARSTFEMDRDRLEVVRLAEVAPERVGDERAHRARVRGDDGELGVLCDERAPVAADDDRRRLEAEQRRLEPQLDRIAARLVDAPEPCEVGEPAGQLGRRRVAGVGVLAEHLGLLAHLAAGRDGEVGEPALGLRARDLHAGGGEVGGEHLGGHLRAHAGGVQQPQRAVRLGGECLRRGLCLLVAAVREPEVAGVAGRLAVAQKADLSHDVNPYRFRAVGELRLGGAAERVGRLAARASARLLHDRSLCDPKTTPNPARRPIPPP